MSPRDIAAAVAIVLLWAVNFSANKVAVGQLPPVAMVALRFALIALLLAPLLRRPGKPFWRIALLSLTIGSLHMGLYFGGLKGIGAGLSAIVGQLAVPFSAILAALVFGERTGLPQAAGMLVAFAGVYLVAGEPRLSEDALHLTLAILSAVAFAAANVQIKMLGPINVFVLNGWLALLAAPQMALASWLIEDGQLAQLAAADWRAWAAFVFTTVTGGIAAYGLWYYLIGRHPVNRIMPITLLPPGLGVLIAGATLGEPITAEVVIGTVLTLVGVAVIQMRRRGRRAPVEKGTGAA